MSDSRRQAGPLPPSGLIAQAEERTRALEGRRDTLLTEVAEAREAHQRAAAEAAALSTVVAEQRRTLKAVQALRPVLSHSKAEPTARRRKPSTRTQGSIGAAGHSAEPAPSHAVRRRLR